MHKLKFAFFILSSLLCCKIFASPSSVFRLHIQNDPVTFDPVLMKTQSYLQQNIHRRLFSFTEKGELKEDLAEKCQWVKDSSAKNSSKSKNSKSQTYQCLLKKNQYFSNGETIKCEHFKNTFARILDPQTNSPQAIFLKGLAPLQGSASAITCKNDYEIHFKIETQKGLWPEVLTHENLVPLISPPPSDIKFLADWPTSGAFHIVKYEKSKSVLLERNTFYAKSLGKTSEKPLTIEFKIISDEGTAMALYENKELDFLRKVPTAFIKKAQAEKDFHWVPLWRFDYFAMGNELLNKPELRKALTQSLDYAELQKVYNSPHQAGCTGLPKEWGYFCHQYKALDKAALQKLSLKNADKTLNYNFSAAGGDDHRRVAEWLQEQLKKNLEVSLKIQSVENKIFYEKLHSHQYSFFRKGVPLEIPACWAALQEFQSTSKENDLNLKSKQVDEWIQKLAEVTQPEQKKLLCQSLQKYLMDQNYIIPTGAMSWAIRVNPQFKGWVINPLFQLDLSQLAPSQLTQ